LRLYATIAAITALGREDHLDNGCEYSTTVCRNT
jgi:hypothetical protein